MLWFRHGLARLWVAFAGQNPVAMDRMVAARIEGVSKCCLSGAGNTFDQVVRLPHSLNNPRFREDIVHSVVNRRFRQGKGAIAQFAKGIGQTVEFGLCFGETVFAF